MPARFLDHYNSSCIHFWRLNKTFCRQHFLVWSFASQQNTPQITYILSSTVFKVLFFFSPGAYMWSHHSTTCQCELQIFRDLLALQLRIPSPAWSHPPPPYTAINEQSHPIWSITAVSQTLGRNLSGTYCTVPPTLHKCLTHLLQPNALDQQERRAILNTTLSPKPSQI